MPPENDITAAPDAAGRENADQNVPIETPKPGRGSSVRKLRTTRARPLPIKPATNGHAVAGKSGSVRARQPNGKASSPGDPPTTIKLIRAEDIAG